MSSTGIDVNAQRQQTSPRGLRAWRVGVKRVAWRSVLDVITAIAMLSVAMAIAVRLFGGASPPRPPATTLPMPTQPINVADLQLLGAPDAKAGLVVFSDFQCPFCARFSGEILPLLKKQYVDRGLLRIGFRHFPLSIHNRAMRAAESAECAGEQGQFWSMHDALFQKPLKLEEQDLSADAARIGLNSKQFEACMSRSPSGRIKSDFSIGQGLGFAGTPSFVVGRLSVGELHATSIFVGTQPMKFFEEALERALNDRKGN